METMVGEDVQRGPRRAKPADTERSARLVAGGTLGEAVCGAAAVVLGILGLVGLAPVLLASIATIAVGAALAIGGSAVAARYSRLLSGIAAERASEAVVSEMATETLFGFGGVTLGVLALLGVAPLTLLSIASIVLGAGLVLSSGALARMNDLLDASAPDEGQRMAHGAVSAASGTEVVFGLVAIVLGILALAGSSPVVMTLVSTMVLGASVLLTGTSIATRLLTIFR